MSALKYWLWLTELPGLTNQTRLALLQHFPTPEDVYYAEAEEVLLTEGITREEAELRIRAFLLLCRCLGRRFTLCRRRLTASAACHQCTAHYRHS